METLTECVSELEAKATLHSLLAQAMNYPDARLVDSLCDGSFFTALGESLAALNRTSVKNELKTCRTEYQQKNATDKQTGLLDLERAYTRMFFSSKPRLSSA